MMPLITNCLTTERDSQDEQARPEMDDMRHRDGANDAAFGRRPEFADEGYLEGYFTQLRQLPTDAKGRIQHYSPRQHFAFGFMDGVDSLIDSESNY